MPFAQLEKLATRWLCAGMTRVAYGANWLSVLLVR